ncbi:MAG: transglycosylase SLT domain-containing protein, partial [Candidatus Binataceae bacterium]
MSFQLGHREPPLWQWWQVLLAVLFLSMLAWSCVADAVVPIAAQKHRRALTTNARAVWGLSAPIATFAAQVHQESGWHEDARSPFAGGLAQFTPDTAQWISRRYNDELREADPFNPSWALRA